MLRIRPTSICLSESDVEVHFHQINLYRTLRRQGYSKTEIQHLYDMQQQIKRNQENDVGVERLTSQSSSDAAKAPDAASPPESSPAQDPVLYRHSTVRHGSLLRFGQTITPESPDGASTTKVDRFPLPKSPKSHMATYRPRSQTYTEVESEEDDETEPDTPPFQYPVDELANLSIGCPPTPHIRPMCIPLRAEGREFAPLALPPPRGSITSQASSQTEYQAERARITPTLVTRGPPITPLRRSSLANQVSSQASSPSSSPVSLPAPLPATPSLVRTRPRTHTKPRTHHGYGDLSRLSIYNDYVSPTRQPQTPADLVRRPILTDRDTMYTVLPGSVGRSQRVISNESPTRRRELWSRWTREYERAEAVERERVNMQRAGRTFWLDEWAVDRVGEENP